MSTSAQIVVTVTISGGANRCSFHHGSKGAVSLPDSGPAVKSAHNTSRLGGVAVRQHCVTDIERTQKSRV